jgi:hypothetical protein
VGDHRAGRDPHVDPEARAFSPHASFKQVMASELRRYSERPPELQPKIDATEAFLLAVPPSLCHLLRQARQIRRAARLLAEERGPMGGPSE